MKTIERLRELEKAIHPGKWYTGGGENAHGSRCDVRPWPSSVAGGIPICTTNRRWNDDEEGDSDEPQRSEHARRNAHASAAFIAEMRNALPALLAVVEAAERFRELTERDDDDLDARFNARGQMFAALRALEGEG